MQVAIGEFFEDVNEALRDAIKALGGNKKVGPVLWPELAMEAAANRLRDCLNPERREKLSPEQFMLILRLARQSGHHSVMQYLAFDAGYEAPRPVLVEDQEAQLQRSFVDAVDKLTKIQEQLNRVQMRRVV